MMTTTNRQVILAEHPVGLPNSETWRIIDVPMPDPGPGELVAEVMYLSVDPAMRQWIAPDGSESSSSAVPHVRVGDVMPALAVGRVTRSRHDAYAEGDLVSGTLGVQHYSLSDGTRLRKLDPSVSPVTRHLSVLGMSGLTAYFGMLEVGRPGPGDTVVVSGAAGGVGSIALQLARIQGARTVGIAGGADKCRMVTDVLGADAAVDHRIGALDAQLAEQCPDGINVYFDNVGGEVLDAVLIHLARAARVVLCGWMSQYNAPEPKGPGNYVELIHTGSTMAGFSVFDFSSRYREASRQLSDWLDDGALRPLEDVLEGLDTFPRALPMLFEGRSQGKLMIKVAAG